MTTRESERQRLYNKEYRLRERVQLARQSQESFVD